MKIKMNKLGMVFFASVVLGVGAVSSVSADKAAEQQQIDEMKENLKPGAEANVEANEKNEQETLNLVWNNCKKNFRNYQNYAEVLNGHFKLFGSALKGNKLDEYNKLMNNLSSEKDKLEALIVMFLIITLKNFEQQGKFDGSKLSVRDIAKKIIDLEADKSIYFNPDVFKKRFSSDAELKKEIQKLNLDNIDSIECPKNMKEGDELCAKSDRFHVLKTCELINEFNENKGTDVFKTVLGEIKNISEGKDCDPTIKDLVKKFYSMFVR